MPAEALRPAKKLPPSPQKQTREEPIKPSRPVATPLPTNGLKHALEQEETRQRTANYTAAGKPVGQPQHVQDVKRRRTDETEEKETITGKPMRVSVSVKQVCIFHGFSNHRTLNRLNQLENLFANHIRPTRKKVSKSHQLINTLILAKAS